MGAYTFKADGSSTNVRFYPRDTEGGIYIDEQFVLSISPLGAACGSLSNQSVGTDANGTYFQATYTAPADVPAAGTVCEFIAQSTQTAANVCRCPFDVIDPAECAEVICCPTIDKISLGPLVAGEVLTGQVNISAAVGQGDASIDPVSMPAGTAISSDGVLSGTLPQAGTYSMNLALMDDDTSCGVEVEFEVVDPPDEHCPIVSAITIPALIAGQAMSGSIDATGNSDADVSFTAVSLPTGMTIDADGNFGGVVPAAGSYPLVVAMSDGSVTCTLSINVVVTEQGAATACPAITALSLTGLVEGEDVSGSLTATSQNEGTISYALSQAPAGWAIDSDTGAITGVAPAAGSNFMSVTVSDGVVACDITVSFDVAESTAPCPRISAIELGRLVVGEAVSGQLTAEGSGTVTMTATGLPTGWSLSTAGVLSGPAPESAGSIAFTVTLADDVNSCVTPVALNVADEAAQSATCPVLTAIAVPAIEAGVAFSGSFNASGNGQVSFTGATGLPQGVTLNGNGTLSGTAAASGSFPLSITMVDDDQVPCTFTYQLIVNEAIDRCPKIGSVFAPSAVSGEQYAGLVTASGVGNITYSMTSLSGLSIDEASGQISGTFTSAPGTYRETVTVTDSQGSCDVVVSIRAEAAIVTPGVCPRLSSVPSLFGVEGQAWSKRLVAINGDGTMEVSFSHVAGLPPGLSVMADGTIAGTSMTVGPFTAQVRLTDGDGNNCIVSLQGEVVAEAATVEPPAPPVVDAECEQLKAIYRAWIAKAPGNTGIADFMAWMCVAEVSAPVIEDEEAKRAKQAWQFWREMHEPGGSVEKFLIWISKQPDCPSAMIEPVETRVMLLCNREINGVHYMATRNNPACLKVERNTAMQLIANGEATMAP